MEDDWVAETAADLLAKCKAIPRHFVRLVALSERGDATNIKIQLNKVVLIVLQQQLDAF
jgi:hypothetical protein